MPEILLVRHGNTPFDKKVDALLDPPLNQEGVDRIKRTVEFLRKNFQFKRIVSSPLQRALKAAEMISDGNCKIIPSNGLLPWNLGDYMGHYNKDVDPKIDYLMRYPDIKAPHGESYRSFYLRWDEVLHRLMQYAELHSELPLVLVTHSRNINALGEIIDGLPVGDAPEVTPEASVTLLATNGVDSWSWKRIWNGK